MSWESIKEVVHKAWSNTKDWLFRDAVSSQVQEISLPHSSLGTSENPLKHKEEMDCVKTFGDLLKERDSMPFALYQTSKQSKRMVEIREQLDEIGSHIFKTPKLMESAKALGIESAVHVAASSYDMKITQAKEKALGLDQGIGLEMSLTKDDR